MRRLLAVLAFAMLALPGLAQDRMSVGPVIPEATGEPHPEGNEYMRRWHMKMMRHDRDLTMYDGDRAVNASLAECFDCHTVRDDAGTPVTYADARHFCRTCHDYAAVQVDCFDCHRSTPEDFDEPASHAALEPRLLPRETADVAQAQAWLDRLPRENGELR